MKIAFLDRDGTINKDYSDEVWTDISQPELFGDTISALNKIKEKGYEIIIITNQYIIGEGYITIEQYKTFTDKLIDIMKDSNIDILDIFYCPHSPSEGCNCCKPKPGLILKALEKYPDIVLEQSFFSGDSIADYEVAKAIGIPYYKVDYMADPIEGLMDVANDVD